MVRARALSSPARNVLAVLAAGEGWYHGYELCRQVGIKSGTLYPLLIRLAAQGYLEAQWRAPVEPGRPPRHAYRLTAAGRALAQAHRPGEASGASGLKARPA